MDIHGKIFDHLYDEGWERYPIFPLQTQQSLAERWGVSRQNVAAWAKRHADFPRTIEGIIEKTAKTPLVYPLHEVKKYEQKRGLI